MPKIALLLLGSWSAANAQVPIQVNGGPTTSASLEIVYTPSQLAISGDSSSLAHEDILRRTVRDFFDSAGIEQSKLDLRYSVHAPAGWALLTDMVLRAVSATRSSTATVTGSGVRIRGVTGDGDRWDAAHARIHAALLTGMNADIEVIAISESDSYYTLCRRQFLTLARDNQVRFVRSGHTVVPGAYATLDAMVQLVTDCPQLTVKVVGHTDTSGDESVNVALSQARADAVVRYMLQRGLHETRLQAVGAGSAEPKLPETEPQSRRINRRVEFRLLEP